VTALCFAVLIRSQLGHVLKMKKENEEKMGWRTVTDGKDDMIKYRNIHTEEGR
jgi:hypothetical protein